MGRAGPGPASKEFDGPGRAGPGLIISKFVAGRAAAHQLCALSWGALHPAHEAAHLFSRAMLLSTSISLSSGTRDIAGVAHASVQMLRLHLGHKPSAVPCCLRLACGTTCSHAGCALFTCQTLSVQYVNVLVLILPAHIANR